MHNHSDYTILVEPKSESMIRQGVTTMVLGESRSAGPIKAGADEARARADGVDGRLDDAGRLLREARAAAHVDEHRLVRRRGTGLDLRQRLRPVAGDAGGDRRR